MVYPIFRRHRRSARALESCVRFAVDALEQRVLLNAYVVTNVNNSGAGSLRDAIQQANANAGFDLISFNIPGGGVQTITPTFALPQITDPVDIDATTQPGYAPGHPTIELNGASAGNSNGLEIVVGGNSVLGLDIHSFAYDGIVLAEPGSTNPAGGNVVSDCFIGTDPTGELPLGNGLSGIHLVHSPHNQIKFNLISGNRQSGVFAGDKYSTDNQIFGNLIGTDASGMKPLGNGLNGVALGAPPNPDAAEGFASLNVVGGTDISQRNVIAGNAQSGVWIEGGTGNLVQGNYIGVAADGVTPLANGTAGTAADPSFGIDGVYIVDGSSNTVGGVEPGAGNVISANARDGVRITAVSASISGDRVQGNLIGTDSSGEFAPGLGNAQNGVGVRNDSANPSVTVTGIEVGGSDAEDGATDGSILARNVISGNFNDGVLVAGPGVSNTRIDGNFIGTDQGGIKAVNNFANGVEVVGFAGGSDGPFQTLIGDELAGAGNVISGNDACGVLIANNASGSLVRGNLIGTTADGLARLGNGADGVQIANASANTVGGAIPADRNVISANSAFGINILGSAGGPPTTGNVVAGNFIGTDVTGERSDPDGTPGTGDELGNTTGVSIVNASGNIIGLASGTTIHNVISGNTSAGVAIGGALATHNLVQANLIGVAADQLTRLGNQVGVFITAFPGQGSASGNVIGGNADINGVPVNGGNVISANAFSGVVLNEGAFGNTVSHNYIGTDFSAQAGIGNGTYGIGISAASANIIGGTDTLSGNVIINNGADGVFITDPASSGNVVEGNDIGIDPRGENRGNSGYGVQIANAPANTVGGTVQGAGNDISGNGAGGVRLTGSSSNGNQVLGNTIGAAGLTLNAAGNGSHGVLIDGGASANLIGAPGDFARNVISGNNGNGITILGIDGAQANVIQNNYIGVDASGLSRVPNAGDGIYIENSPGTVIGGDATQRNVISGNTGNGITLLKGLTTNTLIQGNYIGTDKDAANAIPNQIGINLGYADSASGASNTSILGNVIAGNARGGVFFVSDPVVPGEVHDNTIQGNYIGTNPSLITTIANHGYGILVSDSPGNHIGSTSADLANVIAFTNNDNSQDPNFPLGQGIEITGSGSQNNRIEGNRVVGNLGSGIRISNGATLTVVGTPFVGGGNVIIANHGNGITITGPDTAHNTIQNNLVGIDENGTAQGNLVSGVHLVNGAHDNTIGGSGGFEGNVLSANREGIFLDTGSHDDSVLGNRIGTDLPGAFAAGLANTNAGVVLSDSPHNTVGGETDTPGTGAGNTIAGSTVGIGTSGAASTGNVYQGNLVEQATGDGVSFINNASNNLVGGTTARSANRITNNGRAGVYVETGTGNAIRQNQILNNAGLGIDLAPAGVTPNDPQPAKDADTGPNNLQNTPDLTLATTGGSHGIVGTLDSAANGTYTIEFFTVAQPDPSGYGEGDRFLLTATVTTNGSGVATFDLALPATVAAGTFISATATDANGNTSEFSNAIGVQADSDGDGIGDDTENARGDGNGDGIPDAQQANVASFPDAVSGQYVTIQAPDGRALSNVRPLPNPSPDDAPNASFDLGFFGFTLNGVTPGGAADVNVFLPAGSTPLAYYRYGPAWYNWAYNGRTGAQINGSHVTLHFIDGQLGDDDLTANGTIVDPGGPSFPVRFTVTNTNDSGPGSLRQAILDANGHPGQDIINFDIGSGGVQTIIPLSPLPNITDAVTIDGTTQPGFAGTPIVELSGQSTFGNGLTIAGPNVTIRGLVINRWSDNGITTLRFGRTPFNFDIEGNYLGTDVTGMVALGNRWGIGTDGGDGIIGGDTPASRNVISGNTLDGIADSGTFFLTVKGNLIGLAADGTTPLGNVEDGILISNTAANTTVGGPDPADGNIIAFNKVSGIANYLPGQGHAFLSNVIYSNQILGIDLGAGTGADLNDSGAQDNTFADPQNYPVLSSAMSAGGQTTISGYLDSHPNQSYRLQFFSNPTTTASGYGQGRTYLGTTTVQTDANGHADFTATLDVAVADRQLITATATDPSNNTSEFSMRIAVGDVLGNVYVVNTTDDTDDGVADATHTSLREAIIAANNHPGRDTILFNIPGVGVHTIAPTRPLPAIVDSVVLDATSQPGYAGTPLIQIVGTSMERRNLSGSNVATHLTALYVQANDSTICGFALNSLYEFSGSDTSLWGGTPLFINGNNNVVEANFIGTDATGTSTRQNFQGLLFEGDDNRIGGTTPAQRNILSGNFQYAMDLYFGTGNVIEGNLIGTDVTGTNALGNGRGVASESFAVRLDGNDNVFGGTAPGAANVIAATLGDALLLVDAEGTLVQGNLIGTDVTGTKALGNQGIGIQVSEFRAHLAGPGATIGGTAPGAGNVISNNREGIDLELGSGTLIQGNRIGTDITGTVDFGNGDNGILITGTDQQVGGAEPGAGNLISGNGRFGIFIQGIVGRTTTGVIIQGNRIGTQADGVSPMGNGADGIALADDFTADSSGTGPIVVLIGGTDPAEGNLIAYNGRNGVNVLAGQQIGILSNLIYANGALAIDLNGDGVTPNDPGDVDAGDNGLQNFPTFTAAFTDSARTQVEGTLNSAPDTAFLLQFFANPAADASGFGQGQLLLGSHYVFTDAAGNASFAFTFPTAVPAGQVISATATDPLNDTSEFAADLPVTTGTTAANRPPTANAGGPYTINEGDGLALDGSQSDDPDSDPLTYSWDINGDGTFGDATGVKPTLTWAQLQALGIVNGPGSFSVSVRVDDGQGHVVTSAATSLIVLNVAPVADAGPDLYVTEGDTVTLTGTFTDPGTADTHMLNWHVNASNGQVIADGSGSTFSFVPFDNGLYTVTFAVTDSDGATGTAAVLVTVNDAPPVATVYGLPNQGTVGAPINLTATVIDVSPVDTAAGFRYYWEAVLETDDSVDFWVTTPSFTFTPPKPGTYDIYFDATDKDGWTFRYFNTLDVVAQANTAPTVTLGPNATINEGSAYGSAGSFTDPDAADAWTAIVNYGDGTGDQPLALKSDKTFDLSHVYADNGGFDVTVTVTDSTGLSGTQKTHVTVDNVAPALTLGVPSPVVVGNAFTLGGAFFDPGADTWTATVDYGDGTGAQPLALAPEKTFTLNHAYQTAGSFAVTVTVTDKDGGDGTAGVTEVVTKRTASLAAAPASAVYGGTTPLTATLTADGNPLAGKPLLFEINGVAVGSANTDANGTAMLANVALGTLGAGSATIDVFFAEDANDLAATASAPLTVAKAPLMVTVDGKSRVFGHDNPPFTGTLTGLQNGDDITAACATAATNASPVGAYPITATLLDAGGRLVNYDVTITDGTLTVLATTLTAAGTNPNASEGSAFSAVVATFTTDNPIAMVGDFAATIDWGDGHTSAGTVRVAAARGGFEVAGSHTYADHGSYPVSVMIQDNAGQVFATSTAQASVADVAPTVSLNNPSAVTLGTPFTLSGTFADPGANAWTASVDYGDNSGLQPLALGADKTFTLSHTYASAGSFTIAVTVTDDAGEFGTQSVSETVNKLPTSLAAGPATATYGGTTTLSATLTASGTPLPGKTLLFALNGVSVGSAGTDPSGTAVLSNISIGALGAGSATITVTFAEDAQDTAATAAAPLSVARAPLVVTAASASRGYGQANPSLGGMIAGIQNGDDITAGYSTLATSTSPVGNYPITASLNDPGGRLANYDVTVNDGTLTVLKTTLTAAGQSLWTSEGSTFSGVVATFTTDNPIAAAGDFAVTINWGDGQTSTGTVSALGGVGGFQIGGGVTYADNGTYPLSISIQDDVGLGAASATAQAVVANVAPAPAIAGLPASVNAGTLISLTGSAADPSPADAAAGFAFAWTVTRTAGGVTTSAANGAGASFSFTPNDAGVYRVTLTATDKDGGTAATTGTLTVVAPNVAPVVAITGPAAGAAFSVGSPVTFTGTFTDPDSPGAHTAVWTLTAPGQPAITLPGVISGGRVTTTYTFHAAGIYQVALAVTDDQGATGRSSTVGAASAQVVIYDANAGKITGGGWFNSPAGAYAADLHFAGKANFGFNAQYKGNGSIPTGEFQFNIGSFSFHSTAYDWLVVTGDTAQLQGTGTANGRTYAFQLTILDGSHAGRPDRIRIKIWDPLSGLVAYDSQPGGNNGDEPLTTLAGGEAMIHG